MTVSETAIELGAAAIAREGFPRGQESAGDYRKRLSRAALTAALSDQVVVPRSAQDVMDSRNKQFGFAWDLNEEICDAIDAGVTESRAIAARVTTDPRIKLWLPSVAAPASTSGEVE